MGRTRQGFLKFTKSCSHFPKKLLTRADLKSRLYNDKNGYSVQGLLCFAGQLSRKSWEMAPVYVTV